jgi:hypothetical protein
MKVYELLNGVVQDKRVGNFWSLQQAWTLYILKRIEKENDDGYSRDFN